MTIQHEFKYIKTYVALYFDTCTTTQNYTNLSIIALLIALTTQDRVKTSLQLLCCDNQR